MPVLRKLKINFITYRFGIPSFSLICDTESRGYLVASNAPNRSSMIYSFYFLDHFLMFEVVFTKPYFLNFSTIVSTFLLRIPNLAATSLLDLIDRLVVLSSPRYSKSTFSLNSLVLITSSSLDPSPQIISSFFSMLSQISFCLKKIEFCDFCFSFLIFCSLYR